MYLELIKTPVIVPPLLRECRTLRTQFLRDYHRVICAQRKSASRVRPRFFMDNTSVPNVGLASDVHGDCIAMNGPFCCCPLEVAPQIDRGVPLGTLGKKSYGTVSASRISEDDHDGAMQHTVHCQVIRADGELAGHLRVIYR